MRLGISSFTFTWAVGVPGHPPDRPLTALDLLDRARELGVGVVQFADNLPLHRLSAAELTLLERRAGALEIAIEVGTRGIAPANLWTYLRLAQRLGSPLLRVVVDTVDHHPDPSEIVRALRAMVPELQKAGVCLAIENHDRFSAAALAEILARIGSDTVGICLDTVNSFGALDGPAAVVETLGPYTLNLHVKDFAIVRASHMMGFLIEGRPAGGGRLDVPWLLERLRALGRNPNVILELWTPPERELASTIAKEAAWAASSVRYLRGLISN
jgi:sugar phosphate isomerase/epimerase